VSWVSIPFRSGMKFIHHSTARPSMTIRPRRLSQHRSSIVSLSPPEYDDLPVTPSSRASYGFPLPQPIMSGWSSNQPRPLQSSPPSSKGKRPSVLSWPPMPSAREVPEPMTFKSHDQYQRSLGEPIVSGEERRELFDGGRLLPPLRVAIDRRESHYE
jgi:hypothetical protein